MEKRKLGLLRTRLNATGGSGCKPPTATGTEMPTLSRRSIWFRTGVIAIVTSAFAWVFLATPARADAQPITLEMSECGVMAVGTTGTCIYSLQTWMSIATGEQLVRDSYFGAATDHAVRTFQAAQGLDVDGRFGNQSRAALNRWWTEITQNSVATPRLQPTDSVSTPRLKPLDEGAARSGFFSAEEAEAYCHVLPKEGRDSPGTLVLGAEFEALCRIIVGP